MATTTPGRSPLILTACLLLTAIAATAATQASTPGGIDGYLYEPDGTTPVAYGWIDIHDDQGFPWMGTNTAANGYFSIANLPPNFYHLIAYPPSGSPDSPSLSLMVDVLAGFWSSTSLYLTETNLSGWVQDAGNGARIGDAPVVVHDDTWSVELWTTTDPSGEFKFGGLQDGTTYTLEVFGNWILASSYVVDTANNKVTVQLDHFTSFCVAAQTPDTDGDGVVNSIDTDDDDDGVEDTFDCLPLDDIAWTPPSVAEELVMAKTLPDNLSWLVPLDPGAVTLWFDLLMSGVADDFSGAVCVETDGLDLVATDAPDPLPWQVFHYLVRVENPCGSTMGLTSDLVARGGPTCP